MTVRYMRRTAALGVGLATAALALTACGGGGSSASPSSSGSSSAITVTKDDTLAAMVPTAVSSDGKLSFGTDASYAPSEFIGEDGSTIEGFDVDLGNAIAQKLGLTGSWQNADFGTIIVGVNNGKYDLGMSSFTINSDREKQTQMVSYFNAGTAWAVASGNPKGITPDNACGATVAVQTNTVQVDDLKARSSDCQSAGKPAITLQSYKLQSDATSAVVSGKADAMLADSPVVAYAIKLTNGQLESTGDIYDSAPYGIVVPNDQTDMAKAVQGAVQALIDDGTYKQILTSWGVQGGAIATSEINPSVG